MGNSGWKGGRENNKKLWRKKVREVEKKRTAGRRTEGKKTDSERRSLIIENKKEDGK